MDDIIKQMLTKVMEDKHSGAKALAHFMFREIVEDSGSCPVIILVFTASGFRGIPVADKRSPKEPGTGISDKIFAYLIAVDLLTECTSIGTELSGRTDLFKRAVLFLDAYVGRAFIARSL